VTHVAFVDPIGGVAGDMLLAAFLDAGAPEDAVARAVEAVLPSRVVLDTEMVRRAGLRARLLKAAWRSSPGAAPPPAHRIGDLLAMIDSAPGLSPRVREGARAIVDALGEAEARVHGRSPGQLELHELGDDDTLLDVVGVAAALEALAVDQVLVGTIPLGTGEGLREAPGHPGMPLPSPLTLELLRGFTVRGAGTHETVTPTGAAILAVLGHPSASFPDLVVEAIGYGAGARDPDGMPNVVRVVLGSPSRGTADEEVPERPLTMLETNLDDMSPEFVADAVTALLRAGALDAWTSPVAMKKGRPGVLLSVLCDPRDESAVRAVFFETTSTFGVRSHTVRRAELARRTETVEVGEGTVRVKVGSLGGRVVSVKPEHDDVAAVAERSGRPAREVHEEAVAAARVLRFVPAGP
jgi:pyridinium-3,5-bisthiocarboxylic acid mononucleotide nickel chelatase